MVKTVENSKKLLLVLSFMLIFTSALIVQNTDSIYADGHMSKDVLDTALEADDFNTLITAIIEADLVAALKGDGPFTVFAPTDEAFAALPDGVLDSLLENKEDLGNVLLYHVVSGKVMAADVLGMNGSEVKTLLGDNIKIKIEDNKVYINDAQVIQTDIEASNGVIHVIDTVLVP
ncbi:MAG: fasciclin domain-containing protein [Bacillota bacterium]